MHPETDWKLLTRLFADEHAAFRHRMSLFRVDAVTFYAASSEGGPIRADKEVILRSAGSEKYFVETAEGLPAFEEFARLAGCDLAPTVGGTTKNTRTRLAALALEPDWMLLSRPNQRLVWASVCFPTRWSLVGKRLQPLAEIHSVVPDLNEELGRKIDTFFVRLVVGEGWGRANWGLSTSKERNQHPDRPYTPLANETPLNDVYLRIESQHLCKMPVTGNIAFGIRISSYPLVEVVTHPSVRLGLKEQLRTMPAEIAAYKGIPRRFWERL